MASYRGKITTTGRSEAIRFDKALFKSLPAFRQRAVSRPCAGTHTLLVTLDEPAAEAPPEAERDPVMSAFLDFLERDMIENPQTLTPFTEAEVPRIRELVEGVEVRDEEVRRTSSRSDGARVRQEPRVDAPPPPGLPGSVHGVGAQGRGPEGKPTGRVADAPAAKFLARLTALILDQIPRDPNAPAYGLANTLGPTYRHWRRAKFLGRFRLFFASTVRAGSSSMPGLTTRPRYARRARSRTRTRYSSAV